MASNKAFREKLEALREQALARVSSDQSEMVNGVDKDTHRLLHELNAHQIDLELQNEELREAQRQLERSRDRYLQLYHHAPVGYIALNIVRVNMALAQRLGTSPQALVGQKCYQVLHGRERPDGDCPHMKYSDKRMPVRAEVFNPKLKGYFITTLSPFQYDIPGIGTWSIIHMHDISDRKQAEKELLRLRNLESIGKLAGGMAHDFNNLLTVVMGQIELAKTCAGHQGEVAGHLGQSLAACHRAKDLANRLLTFSEGGRQRLYPIRITHLIEAVVGSSLMGTDVACTLDLADDLPALRIDETQIRSALQNVIQNAREAMPGGGILTIKARDVRWVPRQGIPVPEGNYVRIDISDQGSGIAPAHLDKIFDPYFTTKPLGSQKGTGLGLSITHSIIKKHKGHIDIESRPGKGTTVTIFLPAMADAAPEERLALLHQNDQAQPPPRVLFMDDEKILWKVVEEMLKRMACKVDFAANAEEALFLFQRSLNGGDPYAAVILDLSIRGGMGGKEVVRKMRAIDPQVKALAVSGNNGDPVFAEFKRFGFRGALTKPFHVNEFTALVSRLVHALDPGEA